MLELIIDSKECAFRNKIKAFQENGVKVSQKSLDIGDFWITKEGNPIIIIERKTVLDLVASLKDGRYADQKIRIKDFKKDYPQTKILFLLEDFSIIKNPTELIMRSDNIKTSTDKSTILSIISKWMFRDDFFVYSSNDLNESFWLIHKIYKNAEKGEYELVINHDDYLLERRNFSKKTNLTADNWFRICLTQITGMSVAKSKEVIRVYPSMNKLVEAYNQCENIKAQEILLSDIKVGQRRLGKVVSKRIRDFMFGIEPESSKNNKRNSGFKKNNVKRLNTGEFMIRLNED